MKLEYFAALREIAGVKSEEIALEKSITLLEALEEACRRHEKLKAALFERNGELQKYITVLVDGKDFRALKGLKTEIKDEDEVSIFPAVAGG